MIWVSSSCVKADRIVDSVRTLADSGYRYIELSGGTYFYEQWLLDLLMLREQNGLIFQIHNYFPPPVSPFVLNLASVNKDVFNSSLDHVRRATDLSRNLGNFRFGLHAGFLIDIDPSEVGKRISNRQKISRQVGLEKFLTALSLLIEENPDIDFYIENNVLSYANFSTLKENTFLFTSWEDFEEIKAHCPTVRPLLDLAHLKVTCRTLGIDFKSEALRMMRETDYLHLSDNDGLADTNTGLIEHETEILDVLEIGLDSHDVTFEVYSGLEDLKTSIELVEAMRRRSIHLQ